MKKLLVFLVFTPLFVLSQNKYQYKNLALEGGGIRGLAYAGALKVLEEKNILQNIENVAGTSAGAITALMISLDYNSHEIDSILYSLKIQQFNDGKNIFGKIRRVKKEYGIFKGEKFEKWIGKLLQNQTGDSNITFIQQHQLHLATKKFKDVFCVGTNVSKQQLQIFSWQHTPDMKIKTAIHISMCIPIYFKPVAVDSNWNAVSIKKTKIPYDIFVDGGMLCNYPINMFDTCRTGDNPLLCEDVIYNPQTLGLKLESAEQIEHFNKKNTDVAPYKITSVNQYVVALINLMTETLNRKTPGLKNETGRTIYISYNDIFGKPRKVSAATKKILFDNGAAAAERFFNSSQSILNDLVAGSRSSVIIVVSLTCTAYHYASKMK